MKDLCPIDYNTEEPWKRQPCDRGVRWQSFKAFRDQPPPRELEGVREALSAKGLKAPAMQTLYNWASQDVWMDRCWAFDMWLDEQDQRAMVRALDETAGERAERHLGILRDAQTCAMSVVKNWLARIRNGDPLEGWTPRDVARFIRDTIQYERLILGEATERTETSHAFNIHKLTVEELEQLRALEVKAGVVE